MQISILIFLSKSTNRRARAKAVNMPTKATNPFTMNPTPNSLEKYPARFDTKRSARTSVAKRSVPVFSHGGNKTRIIGNKAEMRLNSPPPPPKNMGKCMQKNSIEINTNIFLCSLEKIYKYINIAKIETITEPLKAIFFPFSPNVR